MLEKHLGKLRQQPEYMENLIRAEMGKFNLVLKSENDRLRKFQKEGKFVSEHEAYKAAEIRLESVPVETIKALTSKKKKK